MYFRSVLWTYLPLNILPLELSVNKARILSRKEKEENKWVNVMALSNNKVS